MKNKDFNTFNNDRIASLRARINDLIYLLNTWESKKPRLVDKSKGVESILYYQLNQFNKARSTKTND